MAFMLRPEFAVAVVWFGALLAVAVVVAVTTMAVATPSLQQTATLIDRRLALQDRAVTALRLLEMSDPIAHLVVKDASRRLAEINPASVFPFERRSLQLMLIPPAAAAFFVLLAFAWSIGPILRGDTPVTAKSEEGTASGAGGPTSATPVDGPATADESQVAGAGDVAAQAGEPSGLTGRGQPIDNPPTGARPSEQRGEAVDAAQTPDDIAPGSRPPGTTTTSSEQQTGLSGGDSFDGLPGTSGVGRGAGGGAAGPAATRDARSGGLSPGAGEGSGGVGGNQPLASSSVPQRVQPPEELPYAARYRDAWVKAQTSLAQSRVPRRLRQYVRDYFVAIRPGDSE
jgi:hypothetical protein